MYSQKLNRIFIATTAIIIFFSIHSILSAGTITRNNIIIADNDINTFAKARFRLYFVYMSNAVSSYIERKYKSKPIFVNFYKNSIDSKLKISSDDNRITLTISKNYKDLINKTIELKIINFLFLDRFGLKVSKENIKKISWITSSILKKFTLFEGSDTLKVINTFPIVYKLMLLDKKLKISQIVNTFPANEAYGTPIYRLYEECSEILLYSILSLHNGKSAISDYVMKSCSLKNNISSDVLYRILYKKIDVQNKTSSNFKEISKKADEYLNRIAYNMTFNPRMPLPIKISLEKFNNLSNVKCYMKVESGIEEKIVKLNSLNQNIDNIINCDDLILYVINQLKLLKYQSSSMLTLSLDNIIKELYLLKDEKNIDKFTDRIIRNEQQLYLMAKKYKKIALYLNNAEDELINMSIKYYKYIEIIRDENNLLKEVWPELYNYFMKL